MRIGLAALAVGLAAVATLPVAAKTKSTGGTTVTELDVRTCLGVTGAAAQDQIAACTKLLKSGKIHKGKESDFYASRGAAYYAARQLEQAQADFTAAINQERKPEFLLQRAMIYMALNKKDSGYADFAAVIALRPTFAPAYLMRGVARFQDEDYKAAAADFETATKHRQMYYQAIFARGVAKLRLGDEGGQDDLKEARALSAHVDNEVQALGISP
jgi:tetratricopeptide (TPR) repeat protein